MPRFWVSRDKLRAMRGDLCSFWTAEPDESLDGYFFVPNERPSCVCPDIVQRCGTTVGRGDCIPVDITITPAREAAND